jgi:hypothetical protein
MTPRSAAKLFAGTLGLPIKDRQIKQATPERQKVMNEAEYFSSEFTDAELDAQADAGEFFLDESGFFSMPTQAEIQEMVVQGEHYCLSDSLFKTAVEDFESRR